MQIQYVTYSRQIKHEINIENSTKREKLRVLVWLSKYFDE